MRGLLLVLPLLAAACTADPWNRPGTWQVTGVNNENLRGMVADPRDLLAGRSGGGGNGQLAAAAVDRLRNDKVKPLPDANISPVAVPSGGAALGSTGTGG